MRKHIFWFTFFVGCFCWPIQEKTHQLGRTLFGWEYPTWSGFQSHWQSLLHHPVPATKIGARKKCLVMNLGVLGLLGRYFFCDLLTYHFHISWHVFFFGVSFGFGPYQSFPPFLAMNQAWELLGGDPFVDFHIIFYEVLLTSRWNPNARVNPLTKVAGLHWKYGSRGKCSTKRIPGILTTSSSLGSSKKHGS